MAPGPSDVPAPPGATAPSRAHAPRGRWVGRPSVLLFLSLFLWTLAAPAASFAAATPGGGLKVSGPDGDSLVTQPISHFAQVIRCIHTHGGALWFGTYGSGLFRLEGDRLTQYTHANSPLLEDRVNTLATRGSELWIGTCAGISVTDGHRWWQHTAAQGGVAHDIYHAMRVDTHGNLWVGTTGKGVSRFDGTRWRTFTMRDGLAADWVNDLLEVPGMGMVAATSGGLTSIDGDRCHALRIAPFHVEGPFGSLAWSGDRLWVGLRQEGLLGLWGDEWFRPPADALPSPKVTQIAPAPGGALWIGTERGLALWHPVGGFSGVKDLAGTDIRVLCAQGPSDVLWIGSAEGDLYKKEGTNLRVVVRRGAMVRPPPGSRSTERSPGL